MGRCLTWKNSKENWSNEATRTWRSIEMQWSQFVVRCSLHNLLKEQNKLPSFLHPVVPASDQVVYNKTGKCTYKVTLLGARVTIVAVEKQYYMFRFLWPCIVNIRCWERTIKMQLIRCLLLNFYLNMFRASLCPSSGEQDRVLLHMVFCTGCAGCGWLWSCGAASWAVCTRLTTQPHKTTANHSQHTQAEHRKQ